MKKNILSSSVKKSFLPLLASGVFFSGCYKVPDLPNEKIEKNSFKQKKIIQKNEPVLKEISDKFIDIKEENFKENFCEKSDLFFQDHSDSIFENISSVLNEKTIKDDFEKNKLKEIELEKKEINEFENNLNSKFNWTLWKMLSEKAKNSNLKKIKNGDITVFDNLEGFDLEYYNKLNFFRKKILEGEKISDFKKNIISELRFEYEESEDLIYNADKIFTEVRKVVTEEKSIGDSFLYFYREQVVKEKELERIEKGMDFNEDYFNKRKNKIIEDFSLSDNKIFIDTLNNNIDEILNSKNRYKKLLEFRDREGDLFFEVNPEGEKSFSYVLNLYVKAFSEKYSFLQKKDYVQKIENEYLFLSFEKKLELKKYVLDEIEKNEDLKYIENNIKRTYQAAKKYMFAFVDKDILEIVNERIKKVKIEDEYDIVKNEFSDYSDIVDVFRRLNLLLVKLENVFYSGVFSGDSFDFWLKKRDILKKDELISKYRYNSKFHSGVFDNILTIIRSSEAMDYFKTLTGEQINNLEDEVGIEIILKYFGFSNKIHGVYFNLNQKYQDEIFYALNNSEKKDWIVKLFGNKNTFVKFVMDEFIVESHGLISAYNGQEGIYAGIGLNQHLKIYRDEYSTNPVVIDSIVNSKIEDLYRNIKYLKLHRFKNLSKEMLLNIIFQAHNSGFGGVADSLNECLKNGDSVENFYKYLKIGQTGHLARMSKTVKYFQNTGKYNPQEFFE